MRYSVEIYKDQKMTNYYLTDDVKTTWRRVCQEYQPLIGWQIEIFDHKEDHYLDDREFISLMGTDDDEDDEENK